MGPGPRLAGLGADDCRAGRRRRCCPTALDWSRSRSTRGYSSTRWAYLLLPAGASSIVHSLRVMSYALSGAGSVGRAAQGAPRRAPPNARRCAPALQAKEDAPSEQNTIVLKLKVECRRLPNGAMENDKVYSRDLVVRPGPVSPGIPAPPPTPACKECHSWYR